MADKFQLKAILTAVDKITPTTTQISKSIKIMHKSLRDIGNAGSELMRKIGVPAFLSFSAISFGAIRATQAAIDFAGSVQDASERTGASVEEYQALSNMLIMTGGTAEDAEMAFTKFNKGTADAAAGADKNFAGLLNKLGIPLKNAKGELVSLTDALPQLAAGFARNKDPAKQTRMAMELFGKSGTKIIPMLMAIADGSMSVEQAMKEIVKGESIQNLDAVGNSLDNLAIKSKNTIYNALAKMTPVLEPIIKSMSEWIDKNQVLIQSTITEALTEIALALKAVFTEENIKNLKDTVKGIKEFIENIGGVKTIIYGLGIAWAAGPIAALMSIMGAVWRLKYAFTALSVSATASGAAVAGSFGPAAAASMSANLGVLARSAGLVGAAALVGWSIGTAINAALSDATKEKIGETIAKILATFGSYNARQALAANGISWGDAAFDISTGAGKRIPGVGLAYSAVDALFGKDTQPLVGASQSKLNGEMTVKFVDAPPGMRVESAQTSNSGFNLNADTGYRRAIYGF